MNLPWTHRCVPQVSSSLRLHFILFFVILAASRSTAQTGTLDPTFGGSNTGFALAPFGGSEAAHAVIVQPDRKIIVIGAADVIGVPGGHNFAVARFNSDGTPDPSFGSNGRAWTDFHGGGDVALAVALDSNLNIVVAGLCHGPSATNDIAVARYNPMGFLDTAFDSDGKATLDVMNLGEADEAHAVVIDSLDRIIVCGLVDIASAGESVVAARFLPTGGPDPTFGIQGVAFHNLSQGRDRAHDIAILADGKLVLVGSVGPGLLGEASDFLALRLLPDGGVDSTFGQGGVGQIDFYSGSDEASAVTIDCSGRIVIGGSANSSSTAQDFALARLLPNGSLDTTFDSDGRATADFFGSSDDINDIAIDRAGRIVSVGSTQHAQNQNRDVAIARFGSNGALDSSFNSDGKVTIDFLGQLHNEYADGVAIARNGGILICGAENAGNFFVARVRGGGLSLSACHPQPTAIDLLHSYGYSSHDLLFAYSGDPQNVGAAFGTGPWFGLYADPSSIMGQYLTGVPPFRNILDSDGNAVFSLPPGSLPTVLSGFVVFAVSVTINPATGGVSAASNLIAHTFP